MTADADRKRLIGARLRQCREARPYWSRQDLARLLRAAGPAWPGMPHVRNLARMIADWERGKHAVGPRYQPRYAMVLGIPARLLFEPDVVLDVDQSAVRGADRDIDIGSLNVPGDNEVQRREFHGLAVGVMAGLALSAPIAPTRVGVAHVNVLRASVQQLRDCGRQVGGRAVLDGAVACFMRARTMLDSSDYSATTGRELLALTTDLGIVAGWQAYDSGDQQLARWLYEQAALMAGSVGDDQVAAHLFANMAQQAVHLARVSQNRGKAREALRLAERAESHARQDPSPKVRAVVELRKALAHAQLGDSAGFRASIYSARRELDHGEHSTDPAWGQFISASEITGYEAIGLQRLGGEGVTELYRHVLTDTDRSPRDRAYYRAAFAGALLAEGDRVSALAEGMALLPDLDGGTMTSTRVLAELRPIREATGFGSEEFRARFEGAARALSA